jgi:hypothetical protein
MAEKLALDEKQEGWITANCRLDKWSHCTDTICPLEVATTDPLYGLQGCPEWQAQVLRETAQIWLRAAKVLRRKANELDPPNDGSWPSLPNAKGQK